MSRGVTLADKIAAAEAVEKLGAGIDDDSKLEEAPLIEVLFWGLHGGGSDLLGVPGSVVRAVRDDLDIVISCLLNDGEVPIQDIASALGRLRRRLDVACELFTVMHHPKWAATQHPWVREAAREGPPEG